MKKSFFAVIPALLFASCSFWNEPVEEFFSYWSSEAYVTDSSVKVSKQSDSEGIISVSSDKNAEVILNIANPKNFNLVMPSAGNTEMIHFNAFDPQPVFGTDYMIEKLSPKALKLTYTAQFLKKHEWGQKDLGASITMFADDGREFKKNYTFKIKSNTKPPQPSVILARTTESTPHYVLCLTVPDMDAQVNGKKLHKDIAQIVINESSYELKINDSGSDFVKPTDESFITRTDVAQLTTPGAEAVPAVNWTLFYKTDRQVGGAYKEYTVTLKDQKGLSSEKLETGTTTNKPAEEDVALNAGTQESGSGTNALPFIIQAAGTKPEAQLIISCASSGTTVHCTVTDVSTGTSSEYSGNPANVPLGLNGENEKLYEIKYNTKGDGYNPTTLKTKYYKILKLHTVTFNANGGKFADDSTAKTATVLHGRTVTAPSTSPTQDGSAFLGWYKEEAGTTAWDFTNDAVTENTTLYAKWSSAALFIKSTDADAWKKLKEEAAKTSGVSVIVIEGEIKATTDSGNSGEITIGRNLTIQGKNSATSDILDANGNVLGHSNSHRIFKVTGGKTLTLKTLTLKGGKGEVGGNGGGGIYAEGTLNMTDCTVTDNETEYGNGGGIYAESDLTMTRCTVSNNTVSDNSGLGGGIYIHVTGTHTMTNCTVTNNEAKSSHGGGIYAMGMLSMMNCTVTGNTAQSSGSGSGSGGGIYTTGSLTMTGGAVSNNEAQSNGSGGGIYIGGTGSFTMTSGTVNDNKTAHGDGGGIYIDGTASLTMTGGTLAGNEAVNNKTGGGVYVNGTFTMKGTAYVTPSTGTEANERGKNDVYLANGKKITVDGALTGTHPVARITPAIYADGTVVVQGSSSFTLPSGYAQKFVLTPASDANKNWTLDDSTNNQLKLIDYGVFTIAAPSSTGGKIKLSWKNKESNKTETITNRSYRLMLSPYITDIKLEAECSSSTFLKEWTLTGGGTPPSGYTVEYPNSTSVKGKTITAVFDLRSTLPAGLNLSSDGKTIEEYTGTASTIDFNTIGLGFVEKIKNDAFRKKSGGNFTDNTTIQEVVLPNGLKELGSYAFFDCKALKKVTIPSGFTGDINEVFPGCTDLEEYVIAAGNPRYCRSIQGHLCSKKKTAPGSYDSNDLTLVSVVFKPSTNPTILKITDSRIKEIKNMAAEFHTFTEIQISGLTALSKIYRYAFFKSGGGYEVTIDRPTPPDLPEDPGSVFVGATKIKVPSGSVDAYKAAWTNYAGIIE
ncbi:MAG: InlB B-repeat-containing protein [Treponema sp.]